MQTRPLGRTGLHIAPLVFGGNVFGWTADETTSFRLLDAFADAGLNCIDTADAYSRWVEGNSGGESETIIGDWLAARPGKRHDMVIVTKVGSDMGEGRCLRADYIRRAVEASLSRLKTDYIDLYLAHWPDPETPFEETLGAFAELKEEGKIRGIGASNLDRQQIEAATRAAEGAGLPRYDVLQPEYNLYDRAKFEGPLAEYCAEHEIGVITYYSLASGFLTGKYRKPEDVSGARARSVGKYLDDRGQRLLAALDRAVEATGAEPAEIALAWLRQKPAVTAPIASATSEAQLESLVRSVSLELPDEVMRDLDESVA